MAKPGLTQVTTSQTFQAWLDKTNDLVDIFTSDAVTASALGDTTTGDATLVGSFTANTVIAFDTLRADTFSPKSGSTSISVTAPINTTTSFQVAQTLTSTSGPRINFSSTANIWRTGFEDATNNNFIIDFGSGPTKLRLTTVGNLSTAGTITAGTGGFIGNVTGNLTGNVTGNLTGNVTGDVTGNSGTVTNGVYTVGNQTIGGTKTFSNTIVGSISGNAATVTNGVYTTGAQTIGGDKTFSSNVTVSNANPRLIFSDTDGQNFSLSVNSNVLNVLNNGGSSILNVSQTGGLTASGDVTAFSDVRTKKNISTIENALEKTLSLRGVTFVRINDEEEMKKIGLIAQEVEEVLPEAVVTNEDGYKSIAYGNIVGLLIEAVKELKKEVEELRNAH